MDVENIERFAFMLNEIMGFEEYVDIDELIKGFKGEVKEHSGPFAIISKGSGNTSFVITLPTLTNTSERKYLLAHSIGHLLMHMKYLIDDDVWANTEDYCDSAYYRQGHNIENFEADAFAKGLLMPRKAFFRIAEENIDDGVYQTKRIAEHFEVPVRHVIQRGRELGLFFVGTKLVDNNLSLGPNW